MNLLSKHYKILALVGLLFLIIIPVLVFASVITNTKYRLSPYNASANTVFKPISSNNSSYQTGGICFYNNSSADYFIPNKTYNEWGSFYNLTIDANPSTVYGVTPKTDCCLDGVCSGPETSDNCALDCGSVGTPCPTSVDFIDSYTGLMTNIPVIRIGTQCWLQKNIGYNDLGGRQILGSVTPTNNAEEEKYCYSNSYSNCSSYGALYTWNEAMQYSTTEKAQGVCPDGWHVPTAAEFTTLSTALGGDLASGGVLKGQGAAQFKALLSGFLASGSFYSLNTSAFFWTSTVASTTHSNSRSLNNVNNSFSPGYDLKTSGLGVRCVRDVAAASYTLVYSSGLNGVISGTTVQTVAPGGSGTAVSAVPNTGYRFSAWSDGSTANPRTDTNVNADKNVTASYVSDPCGWGLCDAACTQNCPVYVTGSGGAAEDPCSYGACASQCCYYCMGGYCQ